MVKTVLLRLRHVGKHGAGRCRRGRMGFEGDSRQLFLREMVAQKGDGRRRVETVRRQAVDPTVLPLPDDGPDQVVVPKILRDEDFADRESRRLRAEKLPLLRFGNAEFPRGYVDEGQRKAAAPDGQRREIIVLLGIEVLRVEDEAGGDHAGHLPLHHPLGKFRILHLLADGHLEPFFDQFCDVGGCRMVGKTAEGDGVLPVLVPRRQRDLEDPGGGHGILEEHLIEVAHPEEDDAVGVALLHLHILAHGRAQVVHSPSYPFARRFDDQGAETGQNGHRTGTGEDEKRVDSPRVGVEGQRQQDQRATQHLVTLVNTSQPKVLNFSFPAPQTGQTSG